MYWPLNAPRSYAAHNAFGNKRQTVEESNAESPDPNDPSPGDGTIIGLEVARNGDIFATITAITLTIWQLSPVAALTSVIRSNSSIESYGHNVAVLLRPDSSIAIVQTSEGFLFTYHVTADPNARVYQQTRKDASRRRSSVAAFPADSDARIGFREVQLKFRMVIKIDAGISKVLAHDEDLTVATEKPAAVQCIRWKPDSSGKQTTTELLQKMSWLVKKTNMVDMVYDRAMSLYVFLTTDGNASAVQKPPRTEDQQEADTSRRLFRGYVFHTAISDDSIARKAAINARFSLIAVGCASGDIQVYIARDYAGSIPMSHRLRPPASQLDTGQMTCMTYSPDGYCLFVGFEKGWCTWSVYGKLGGNSFGADEGLSIENEESWLLGVQSAHWVNGGSDIVLTTKNGDSIWILEFAKNALSSCYSAANTARTVLYTNLEIIIYQGHELSDPVSASKDPALWLHVTIPDAYIRRQRPVRAVVVSPDGRYVALAGRRGLAHYSIQSGRWKTFDDIEAENEFVVRGGMCWYRHMLISGVETAEGNFELRIYSRELGLNNTSLVFTEVLPAPPIVVTPTGEDSLLVYTYDNFLYHFIITVTSAGVRLVQVGQIGLHGIVRAPARVRAMTWYIPELQRFDGDPSQDVTHASVIFLVDAKLVLLQPSQDDEGSPKYDMRIIANGVEYFSFTPDEPRTLHMSKSSNNLGTSNPGDEALLQINNSLKDSLWFFDGQGISCWTDVHDLLRSASAKQNKNALNPISIPIDFYPTNVALREGIIVGLDSELMQRRISQFALMRLSPRTDLFLPSIIHRYLSNRDASAALSLSSHYQHLPYFPHALEILLHVVLDQEAEDQPSPEDALLPSVISFLSSFTEYLDVIVQCTRKTEVRSWRTLFTHLPPPEELFEESLQKGMLKTAGGYLLVLNTFNELDASSEQAIRLLQMAKSAADWDLCKELARFLMALDESGDTLRHAMERLSLPVAPRSLSVGSIDDIATLSISKTRVDTDKSSTISASSSRPQLQLNGGLDIRKIGSPRESENPKSPRESRSPAGYKTDRSFQNSSSDIEDDRDYFSSKEI